VKKSHGVATLTSVDELDEVSLAKLEDHLLFELDELVAAVGSQEELAKELGYASAASVSKILRRRLDLPLQKARTLDEKEFAPTVPELTFEALVSAISRARDGGPGTDVFLAVPMSASGDKYKADRRRAMEFVQLLRRQKLSVYYAGEDINSADEFDAQNLAFKQNLAHLKTSRRFVLYLPHPPRSVRPSSIWVELGLALGWGLPATLFVPTLASVPFVVERNVNDGARGGPRLQVVLHEDRPDQPIQQLRRHGLTVLDGGRTG